MPSYKSVDGGRYKQDILKFFSALASLQEFIRSTSHTCSTVKVQSISKVVTRLLKRPSHSKLKLANSCSQTQVGVCERYKNSRRTRFYLKPTVCKRVCRLFLCRSHTPTWVCQHEFANLSLPCEGRFSVPQFLFRLV